MFIDDNTISINPVIKYIMLYGFINSNIPMAFNKRNKIITKNDSTFNFLAVLLSPAIYK
jgi:hypothetical protein